MTVIFFFFKQKTAYEMRISDWSSDVCSSDLANCRQHFHGEPHPVLEAAAIFVLSPIEHGGHELLRQVTMRAVQLHPVDPAPLTALRSSSESLYHLPDLGLAHRDGHYPEYRAWKIAGRPWGAPVNWDPVMSRVP